MPLSTTQQAQATLTQNPPSKYAIEGLVRGEPGSFQRVAGLTLLRTAIIAPGLYVAGRAFGSEDYKGAKLVGASLFASASVTLGMLAYTFLRVRVLGGLAPVANPQENVIDTTAEVL